MPTFYPGQTDYLDQLNALVPFVGAGSGQFLAGTAGAPSITFQNNTRTGWYLDVVDQPALSTSGVRRLYVTATGILNVLSGAVFTGNFTTQTGTVNISSDQVAQLLTLGGTAGTGLITLGQSTVAQTVGVATGVTASGFTKTLNLGTGGASGSVTSITLGSATSTTTITANGTLSVVGSMGYATGSGGTVTQLTSKNTAVTLNKPSGQIVLSNSALAAATQTGFALNNSFIAATDTIIVTHSGGTGGRADYSVWVYGVAAGSCSIAIKNNSGGSLSDAVVLNFTVIKGVTA